MATVYNNGVSAENLNVVNDVYQGIDKILRSDIYTAEGRNTLDGFYKGEAVNGKIKEELFIEMASPYTFVRDNTDYVFKGNDAGIHFLYFNDWNYEQSNKELFDYKVREMLDNGRSIDEIASALVVSLRNGDSNKIYKDLKGLLAEAKEQITPYEVAEVSTLDDLLLQIRNAISDFEFSNDTYCAYEHRTLKDNIRIIISAKLVNSIDVVKLANTLNIERAEMDALFWKVDTTDNVIYIVDKNAMGYFTKNTRGYTKRLEELRKSIYYYDNDKLFYYSPLFKATYIQYIPADDLTLTMEAEAQDVEVLGAEVSTLQANDIIVDNFAVSGTLKYKTGYTGYSQSAELQEGNFFAFKVNPSVSGAVIKCKLLGGVGPEVTMDADLNAVVRITSNTQKIRLTITKDSITKVYIYSLANLTLQSE